MGGEFEIGVVLLFAAASLALIVSPGPDSVYVLTQSLASGTRAGVAAACGTSTGILVHTTGAVLGLSVILQTSAVAYAAVRYLGALYLLYLGISTIRSEESFAPDRDAGGLSATTAYRRGALVNVLNPQVAVFFLAFLPQFVQPGVGASVQLFGFGALYSLLTVAYLAGVAVAARGVRRAIEAYPALADAVRWTAGSVLVGFGVHLLLGDAAQ